MRPLDSFGQRLLPGLRKALHEQPGALVLCDRFEGPSAHGQLVAQVARQQGFAGKIVVVPFEDPDDPGQQRLGELVEAWGTAPEGTSVRANLAEAMLCTRLNAVQAATQRLLAVTEAGARNVAVNLSLGSTPALCVSAVLAMTQDPATAQQATEQLNLAFGADIHAGLVQLAGETTRDPRLVEARRDFAEAVRTLESGHNSVVLAAGNDGAAARSLSCPIPAGFTLSDLVTPETTVVGALEGGKPALYNGEGAAVFSPGGFRLGQEEVHGTSFAAPVVAAAMASLHGQFPGLASHQVEGRLPFLNAANASSKGVRQ